MIDPENMLDVLHALKRGPRTLGLMHLEVDEAAVVVGEVVVAAVISKPSAQAGWPVSETGVWIVAKVLDEPIYFQTHLRRCFL